MSESTRRNSASSQAIVYDSAVDLWLAMLLSLAPVLGTGLGIFLAMTGRAGDASIFFIAASITLLITVVVTVPCRYTILTDTLSIRSGLIWYQIPLADIRDVQTSRSLRSGPALSLNRVAIKADRRTVLISPKHRDEFIRDLNAAIERQKRSSAVVVA